MIPRRRAGGGDAAQPLISDEESSGTDGSLSERSDVGNIALLFFLYLLQGIPIGLTSAIPMVLQNRGASYKQQAEFSFVYWPFSLKLLWAPIVDSCYSPRFGRRKTWLIPSQYLLGVFMWYLSFNVESWLGDAHHKDGMEHSEHSKSSHPNVPLLTFIFFCLNFLAATQDIAVDGWALTMLKRSNVGHASTCNSVGQTAGYFLGYVVFMALESAEFCNNYLRSEPSPQGIVTLSSFLYFWGMVFIATTTLVGLTKRELNTSSSIDDGVEIRSEHPNIGVRQTYKLLWDIIHLPTIKSTMLILLTSKIGFSACDAVTSLKLMDAGVPKEELAMLAVPLVPLQIVLPLIISKYTSGPRPMDLYLKAVPYRLAFGLLAAFIVWITPSLIHNGSVPSYYYILLLASYSFHQVAVYSMFVAVMAFFARVSDPAVGGTYMTLLNTLSNLGGNWPSTLALWMVDSLTWTACKLPNGSQLEGIDCSSEQEVAVCERSSGVCSTLIDGYFIETFVCTVLGVLWLFWGRPVINSLQSKDHSSWLVFSRGR
ncbi:acetyl-coenzyme A transporter 1 [Ischnura elegans]|uniref:acetyl-coenzyme A transporter 1 n=1 Tax=Ischnura elegans TaxID=197161 RepID=UPI001ED8B475|nr:acetyl-coenzyme A transporter 1 [Ischnura elegans]